MRAFACTKKQVETIAERLFHSPPCMQMMRSSTRAARGSQAKRELRRDHANSPCWSPIRSMHSSRNPNSALMSAACSCIPLLANRTSLPIVANNSQLYPPLAINAEWYAPQLRLCLTTRAISGFLSAPLCKKRKPETSDFEYGSAKVIKNVSGQTS